MSSKWWLDTDLVNEVGTLHFKRCINVTVSIDLRGKPNLEYSNWSSVTRVLRACSHEREISHFHFQFGARNRLKVFKNSVGEDLRGLEVSPE